MAEALTGWEVKELVYTWFKKLTDKAGADELAALLSADSLHMKFPDDELKSQADFRRWLGKVTHLFFDQVHEVLFLDVRLRGGEAEVQLVVSWQARTWTPPAAYSEWTGFNVHQRWTVVRDSRSGKAVISEYLVGAFDKMKG